MPHHFSSVAMRFARSHDAAARVPAPLSIKPHRGEEDNALHGNIDAMPPAASSSLSRGLDDLSTAAMDSHAGRRHSSSSANLSDSGRLPNVPLHAFSSSGDTGTNATLLLPSDGAHKSDASSAANSVSGASHSFARPLSATEPRFQLSSPLLSQFSRPGSASPSRSVSPFAHASLRRSDDGEHMRPVLHGAAAGAHAAGDQRTQLFVRNLPPHVRWQDLKDLFRRAGTVLRADIRVSPHSPRGADSGTVLFATESDAYNAINTLNGYTWHGHVLEVVIDEHLGATSAAASSAGVPQAGREPLGQDASPNSSHASARGGGGANAWDTWSGHGSSHNHLPTPLPFPGRVLFVGNLPFHCQWQDLKDLFRAAGNIQRADVALNEDGRSRGFGTVLFASPEDARRAVRLYHGYEYSGRILKVHFDRHTHYGPVSFMVPTDPSQYTSAFHTRNPMPHAMHAQSTTASMAQMSLSSLPHVPEHPTPWPASGAPSAPSVTGGATSTDTATSAAAGVAPSASAHHGSHPGRIALPPVSFPMVGAMTPGVPLTPGVPMTPGMPGFILRSVIETPPVYPYMMSPGIAFNAAPSVPNGMNPYLNATPGAPVDMHPMTMAQPSTNMSTIPQWIPPSTHAYAHSVAAAPTAPAPMQMSEVPTASTAESASTTRPASSASTASSVGSKAPPHVPVSHNANEYPFPRAGAAVESRSMPDERTNEPTPSVLPSTLELTNAIAKMSVRGTARTKRAPGTSPRGVHPLSTERRADDRVAADTPQPPLRQDPATKDKAQSHDVAPAP